MEKIVVTCCRSCPFHHSLSDGAHYCNLLHTLLPEEVVLRYEQLPDGCPLLSAAVQVCFKP